jgi:type III pantothenate kinase
MVAGEGVKRRVEEQLELWDVEPRWVVSSSHAAGLTNSYDHPSRLGVDRWVAAIGAAIACSRRGARGRCWS